MRAVGDAFVVVALAEGPQADLVEVMEAKGAGEGIDEGYVGGSGGRDDVCEVELEEPG